MSYEHFVRITSQLPFCSTPIRLDSFNHCQFACGYCFARARMGHGRDTKLQLASVGALRARFDRVFAGNVSSALDEFLERRVPLQLGGMSDPFMSAEDTEEITLGLMGVLRTFDYPYLVSTKGVGAATAPYVDILASSRAYVRFSLTGVDEGKRARMDRGTPDRGDVLRAIETLAKRGILVAIRVQPLFPGHEDEAGRIVQLASSAGARHVSIEYLKVPLEANRTFSPFVSEVLGGESSIRSYINLGATRRGREYVLPLSYRVPRLLELRDLAHRLGLTVGLADNDLLHYSDGGSCCNGIAAHMPGVAVFVANVSAALASSRPGDRLKLTALNSAWVPTRDVSPYLNSHARLPKIDGQPRGWPQYMTAIWNGNYGVHGPEGYFGVVKTGETDAGGNLIYERQATPFDRK